MLTDLYCLSQVPRASDFLYFQVFFRFSSLEITMLWFFFLNERMPAPNSREKNNFLYIHSNAGDNTIPSSLFFRCLFEAIT